jgi:hypothetical protein
MSNSSRIEVATRQHVGATLTNEQIVELVKISNPEWKGGVYPSDAAYKREGDALVPRGKTAYGDGVLEYLGENAFKVLADKDIVRRPTSKKKATPAPAVAPVVVPATAPVAAAPVPAKAKGKGKPTAKASQPPVAPKSKARDAHVS